MLYYDGVHLVADTIEELHESCEQLDIPRNYFEGVKKGHPHYDIIRKKDKQNIEVNIRFGAVQRVNSRALLLKSKELIK